MIRLTRLVVYGYFRVRIAKRERVPRKGGLVVVANHQSYIDPSLVAACINRRVSFMARQTLFRHWLFGFGLWSLGAFPIDRDGAAKAGVAEAIRRLKGGAALLMFPEGSRSRDGQLGELKPGFALLARRARVPVLPVWVDGSFEAWPPGQKWPKTRAPLKVTFGEPISVDEVRRMKGNELVEAVREQYLALKAGEQTES